MPNNLVLPKAGGSGMAALSRSSASGSANQSGLNILSPRIGFAVLLVGKLSRVVAAFVSYSYLESSVALPLFLFFVTLGAAVFLLSLQRPWSGRRIGAKRGKKLLVSGVLMSLMLYVWSAGLRSAGPLRALLVDGAEIPLLYIYAVVSGRELPEQRKSKGAFLMIAAYALLFWDASGHAPDLAELEKTSLGRKAEDTLGKFGNLTADKFHKIAGRGKFGLHPEAEVEAQGAGRRRALSVGEQLDGSGSWSVWDMFVEGTALRSELGVTLVLAASVIMQASRPFTRRLSAELGGVKRQFALTVTSACVVLAPLAFLSFISSSTGALLSMRVAGSSERVPMNAAHVVGFGAVGFLWLVLPYYIRSVVSSVVDQGLMLQTGVFVPFILAAIATSVFGLAARAGGVSWLLIAAFILDIVGLSMMVAAGGAKRALSELPLDSRASRSSINGSSSVTSRGE